MVYRFHYLPSGLFNRAQVGVFLFVMLFMDGWVICSSNPMALRMAKTLLSFDHSESSRVNGLFHSACISVRDRAHQRVIMKGCIH